MENTLIEQLTIELAEAWMNLSLIAPDHLMDDLGREVWLSAFRPVTDIFCPIILHPREANYREVRPSIGRANLPDAPAALKFQQHILVRPYKGHGPEDYEPDDFENLQHQHDGTAHYEIDGLSDEEAEAKLAAKKGEKVKQNEGTRELTLDNLDALAEATQHGVPHLEISSELILLRFGEPVIVSMPPPHIVTAPTWKCEHGVTKARDGNAYACSLCSPTISGHQPNWHDRLRIEESKRDCELCGNELKNWQEHYCVDCWKIVSWTLQKKGTNFTSEFFTKGAASKFQEKKAHKVKRSDLPTWNECLKYLQIVVTDCWWSLSPDRRPGDYADLFTMPWLDRYFKDIPWVKTFVTRWWMVTHDFTMAEIEGCEGVQLDHYFARDAEKIRETLALRAEPLKSLECAMSS